MTRRILVAISLFSLLTSTGCSTFTKEKGSKKDSPWSAMQFWKKEYQQPTKMAVLWSHDILTVAGQPPTRGFGGRIYFYNNKSQTIPVEGELVVHGFDETKRKLSGTDQTQADKRFRFTAEQFTEHFSQSDLGASYSVGIPWDAADGTQKEITLIPTFISSKGEAVQGAPAKVVLPGRAATTGGNAANTQVQTVAYEQSSIPTVDGKLPQLSLPSKEADKLRASGGDMRTTTIKVPPQGFRGTGRNTPTSPTQSQAPSAVASPPVPSALDQARAQAVADAFQPVEAIQQRPLGSFSAWTPSNVPLASSQAVNSINVTPPGGLGPQTAQVTSTAKQPTQAGTQAATQSSTQAGQATHSMPIGMGASHVPSAVSAGPSRSDSYPGGLPPGFQLSPRANAW